MSETVTADLRLNSRYQSCSAVNLEHAIAQGTRRMAVDVTDTAVERLAAYLRLLERWNRVYNLTAVRGPQDMVVRHILDSLSILPWLRGSRVLDVGSGAGLPGIPLAIVQPHLAFYLLDSNSKRTRFMTQAVAELGITNVEVVHCRVEDYPFEGSFDTVVSRAFASLAVMLASSGRLCAAGGCLLAMKGRCPDGELRNLPTGYALVGIYRLPVPSLDGERHLVHFVPIDSNTQVSVSWPIS